jgi:hypothetical protein
MRLLISTIGLLTGLSACAETPAPRLEAPSEVAAVSIGAPHAAAPIHVDGEVTRLRAALMREVPDLIVDDIASERKWIAEAKAAVATSTQPIDRAQLLLVVDRNPDVQQLRIVLARPDGEWHSLGGTKVSTGQTGRRDYYLTPTGVFLHTDLILDWRAQGTFNAQHIRGLGLKGMRVWDFGWQRTIKGWGTGEEGDIRLLLHATDPDALERRLGHPASKGCVRIPAAMNRFLDRHGILDSDYERAAKDDAAFQALLLSERKPTPLAGNALVVVDSSQSPIAALSAPREAAYAVGAATSTAK